MIVGIYLLRQSEQNNINVLLSSRQQEYSILLDKVIDFQSKSLQTLTYDYTYWDEMVDFVNTGNLKWANQMIVGALPSYNADFAWVYRLDFSLVYSASRLDENKLNELPFTKTILEKIVFKKNFYHFFALTDLGLVEISGASVHKSMDVERKTPQEGYFFVGRIWTETFLKEISSFTGSQIHLLPHSEKTSLEDAGESEKFKIRNFKSLPGWDGLPVIDVQSMTEVVIAKTLDRQKETQFKINIILSIVLIISISFFLFRFVNRPLHIISQSLATGDPNLIKNLHNEKTEFGRIAKLIMDFFIQKEKLVKEISDRTHAEDQLKESYSLLIATLDSTTDGILVVDLTGKITGFNKRFKALWQIPEDILASKDDNRALNFMLAQLKDPDIFIEKVRELYKNREAESFDILEFKDGKVFERHSIPQMIEGKAIGRVWSFRDVTEHKEAEEALKRIEEKSQHSQKMESVGTLAGGIAHDFNNILAIIMGHASLLETLKHKPQKIVLSADIIKKAVNRGAGLVNQILTFARKADIKVESLNINTSIKELVDLLQQTFPKTIQFDLDLDPKIPMITGDYNQIHQVLLNLSVNARDAMLNGGFISFRTKVVESNEIQHLVPDTSEKKFLCVSITDSGTGMDEDTKKRIFDPFFTTKEFGKGTGLGLATAYGILQSHGGFIEVESQIDIGTTFYIYFPINPEDTEIEKQQNENSETEIKGGNETILIVEDEEMLLDLIKEILIGKGYKVLTALDGLGGLEVYTANAKQISLVLTDMGLPKLNGYDMVMKLKEINPAVNVIFASGFLETDTISKMFKAGAKEFVQKPYDPIDVLKKIRSVIDIAIDEY